MDLHLNFSVASTFSLAAQQNAYPLLRRLLISASENLENTGSMRFSDLRVRLTSNPIFFEPEEWLIDRLESGQSTKLQDRPLKPDFDKLNGLTEEMKVQLIFSVSYIDSEGRTKELTSNHEVSFLPADYWGGESRQPELLGAFVQPNVNVVESITSNVAKSLRDSGSDSTIDGYQSNTRDRPYIFGAALWASIFNERLMYLSPPNGWAENGQRIRSAANILEHRVAACLDTSVLFASCLENMGLNPVIAITKSHAFAGFWLIDECFPVLTNDDPIDLRKRIDTSDLVMFETTLVTNDSPVTFKQAIERAKTLLEEDKESEFVMLIDIKQARARRIKPLGVIEEAGGPLGNRGNTESVVAHLEVEAPPPLPPVRSEERIVEETPETRIDMWQRKLLDLTKRNPLLSVKSSALKLFCPDLATLEDKLAAGQSFKFISAEEVDFSKDNRNSEIFRLTTGDDIHREYAIGQLNKNILIVNDTKKRKESKLIELLRKAKNDLEEGGSNTLFLSIGMLRWKEVPESEKTFRAPLILLPVKLERSSAQAAVKIRQLPDEEPIFNLTLIEMLQADYDINLESLRHDLPEDESGVDVEKIWNIVRDAIKEQPGFIVVEEIVLGSFSFAKYLMWKDLRDRTDLLKQSLFVEHLVDKPKSAYQQELSIIERDEVDQKIKPENFYAPLNCDSSQMVAVDASSRPQDFVLEGPPGTGKSETIANIICHNLALGRKVLFVAEKMAALQVVYRRMEKIGLAHLCLELHSNKSNKKAVLDQLASAWTKRESASQSEWVSKAKKLEQVRHSLNEYVLELHKKHPLGFSARDAMARSVRYEYEHPLRLKWPDSLTQAPLKVEADIEPFLEVAKELGVAFGEVQDLNPTSFHAIGQLNFSNQWQSEATTLVQKIITSIESCEASARKLLDTLDLKLETLSPKKLALVSSFSELCDLAISGEVGFALQSGGQDKVKALADSISIQTSMMNMVDTFGSGLKWGMLEDCDWDSWVRERNSAVGIFSFFKLYGLRKRIKASGLQGVQDLSKLELGLEARNKLRELYETSKSIQNSSAWPGVGVDKLQLESTLNKGQRALSLLNEFLGAFSDPLLPIGALRRHLIDGQEFLSDSSQVVTDAKRFHEDFSKLNTLLGDASNLQININSDQEVSKISGDLKVVLEQSQKLSRWCHWLTAKRSASQYQLEPLSEALESRVILPDECLDNALTALCVWLAPKLIDQSPALIQFAGASHESMIEKFRELDCEVSGTTSEYIIAKTAGKVPDRNAPTTPAEYGVLARELTKKTRHKPVRLLVSEMGDSLTDLVPCFMMSPLSVAQFLPADFALFDLVVFDEASQITTWDAVGAIARGKNVIVVGDPKQMPPSNNFGRKDDEDSDEGDLESILDQALAARLPHLRLTGHYRSRHETLIAFSNSHYYENQLTTFPSAETKQSAVTLFRVDGVYAKGRGQTNSKEAQAVVNEVVRRLNLMLHDKASIQSIGIVTINSQQQRMVEDFLDEARRKNSELEVFFTATDDFDPVFVKNLESVQGDERDIIILSLTYGPTESGARTMSMNFGPLNKQGGERRLNVAVTRATSEVLVFSSFDSSMIDLSRTQATAIEHLKNYLEFAERGPIALAEYSSANYGVDQFDSEFEQAVAISIREKGWKIQTQVGVSKFRVDLGVIHPDKPGEYLAGIECDGATYHGSPAARDRDRVRQLILENLGWRIVRLWSTDYFQDSGYAINKLHDALEQLLLSDREKMKEESLSEKDLNDFDDEIDSSKEDSVKLNVEQISNNSITPSTDAFSNHEEDLLVSAISNLPCYDKDKYFDPSHRMNLSNLARSILEIKNGITLHELTLDVANKHGMTRSSRKQIDYLKGVIKGWAGFWNRDNQKTTVFLSPSDVCDELPWRGLYAFGEERDWSDLCFQEQVGVAREAVKSQPSDPVDWLFKEFKLNRRHENTTKIFQSWVDRVR